MEEDWERLLDGALERKRTLGKSVKFTEFKAAPGEARGGPPPPPPPPPTPTPTPGNDQVERLRSQARMLGEKVRDLMEENRRLRSELESRPPRGTAPHPADGEEVERLKREINEARAVIRSIEAAYRMGRRRSRK